MRKGRQTATGEESQSETRVHWVLTHSALMLAQNYTISKHICSELHISKTSMLRITHLKHVHARNYTFCSLLARATHFEEMHAQNYTF